MPLFLVVVHFVHTMPESFATHLKSPKIYPRAIKYIFSHSICKLILFQIYLQEEKVPHCACIYIYKRLKKYSLHKKKIMLFTKCDKHDLS